MRLSKCERNKHLLRWSLEKSLLELLPLLLQRFLMFAEACQSFQHPGLQERAALMFLIGCTRKTTGLAFSLRLRFGFCYRVLCYLRLKVLSSDPVWWILCHEGKGMCKLSLWWYYIIIDMYAMYMQCITMQYDMYTMINCLCRSDVRWILMFSKSHSACNQRLLSHTESHVIKNWLLVLNAALLQGRFPKNIWVLRGIALFGEQLQTCWVCQSFVACVALSCVMDSWSPGLHILENTKRRAKIPSTEILRAVLDSSLSWTPCKPLEHRFHGF